MNLKYTACLASLLMACPIAASTASAATGWEYTGDLGKNWYYDYIRSKGDVKSLNNHVTSLPDDLPDGSLEKGFVVGCPITEDFSTANTEASNNSFTYNGGKFGFIHVGDAGIEPQATVETVGSKESKAEGNKIILTNAEVKGSVWCGSVWAYETATSNDNRIELNGGTYGEKFSTEYSRFNSIGCQVSGEDDVSTIQATNNRIILKGGTYNVAFVSTCLSFNVPAKITVANNSVELYVDEDGNSPKFYELTVISPLAYDYKAFNRDRSTMEGNSLNLNDVKNMTAGNIAYFQELNFEYSKMLAGDVILTLTGTESDNHKVKKEQQTSIADAKVTVSVKNLYGADGQSEFKTGDKVVLLKNANGIDAEGMTTNVTALKGATLFYDAVIVSNEDKTELYLTSRGTKVRSGTKAIAEGAIAGLALASESSNAAIGFLREFSLVAGSITPFVHVQASSMRHETGSSINMSAVSLLAGLGTGIDTGAGHLSAGSFFEYGKGSYTTSNSFDNAGDVNGDGSSWYMGGGILAKMDFLQTGPGHFYLEGSAHMGTLHNEYDSNDLTDFYGNSAKFDMDSPYYSLHGGIGYVWNMAEGHDLDIYGKYIWTRVQGTDDTLTTGDQYEFDDMDSNRIRLGVRYTYNGSERFSPYIGVAFEHEFSGSCESRAFGYRVAAPSFEGSSGMGELGLMMKPTEDLPLSINLGVQGYVGQKQGISGSCNVMYEF